MFVFVEVRVRSERSVLELWKSTFANVFTRSTNIGDFLIRKSDKNTIVLRKLLIFEFRKAEKPDSSTKMFDLSVQKSEKARQIYENCRFFDAEERKSSTVLRKTLAAPKEHTLFTKKNCMKFPRANKIIIFQTNTKLQK